MKTSNHSTPLRSQLRDDFMKADAEALLDQKTIAAFLSRTHSWCEAARHRGTGPRYVKLGRSVRYRKSDVLAWLKANSTEATSTADCDMKRSKAAKPCALSNSKGASHV